MADLELLILSAFTSQILGLQDYRDYHTFEENFDWLMMLASKSDNVMLVQVRDHQGCTEMWQRNGTGMVKAAKNIGWSCFIVTCSSPIIRVLTHSEGVNPLVDLELRDAICSC